MSGSVCEFGKNKGPKGGLVSQYQSQTCLLTTSVEATQDYGVKYRTNKRRKTLGWILIAYVNGFDIKYMSVRMEHLCQAKALIQKKSKVIGRDLELPPSESFTKSSHTKDGERHCRRRNRNSPPENMGNDAMSKALRQISRSPFMHCIEKAKLPIVLPNQPSPYTMEGST